MFRRLESGLPKDPVFPSDLEGLGYFVNENDEIRSIENPKVYYQYFMTRNERFNDLKREKLNDAIRTIVRDRLHDLGLETVRLPLGAKVTEPHLPIFVSSDIKSKKRILLVFGEHTQDLGILDYRICSGRGGISKGSMVNLVKYIQSKRSSTDDIETPAIILANLGQTRWWRKGKKAMTQMSWYAIPSKSLVDPPYRMDPVHNTIPNNRDFDQHVQYIFDFVIPELTNPDAKLEIIGIRHGALEVSNFLKRSENWEKFKSRLSAFVPIAIYSLSNEIENEEFKSWMSRRARAYIVSPEPQGSFLEGPDVSGDTNAIGCPIFSLGEPLNPEFLLPNGYKTVIDWLNEVASDPHYANPEISRFELKCEESGRIVEIDTQTEQ